MPEPAAFRVELSRSTSAITSFDGKQPNAGLDASLFSNRLTLTFDAYLKRTTNLLTNVPLPFNAGAQTPQIIQNVGTVQNKGIELGINSTNIQNQDATKSGLLRPE